MLDVFKGDAFSMQSLTAAINKLPYVPTRLGQLGLFNQKKITTLSAVIEERNGKLALISTGQRGVIPTVNFNTKRKARSFLVPHLPIEDDIDAADVQNVRDFGSEDATQTIVEQVNDKLQNIRQSYEATWEFHRIGAIQGVVLDADASTTIYNWFTEFGITESTVDFDFTAGTQNMKTKSTEVIRLMEVALGGTPYGYIRAICGNNFWDSFIAHATVAGAYEKWQVGTAGLPFSITQQRQGFTFNDIVWENYRGTVGGTDYINTDQCRFFPVGAPDVFLEVCAPANFVETVNTPGKPLYVKQQNKKYDTGIDIFAQSNILYICTRPQSLIKGF